ncbi:MAG: ComEC/Rec2 family competence protein [Oscillospiraceae bacterium]|nr:ComEC/Rec2 family competence protein [Oscillospiraceae bacterium]
MKRILFYVSITLFISIFVASFLSFNVNILTSLVLMITLLPICWLLKNRLNIKVLLILLLTVSFGLFSYALKDSFEFNKLLALDGKEATIEATVVSAPAFSETGVVCDVRVDKIFVAGVYKKFKAKLYLKDEVSLEPYSKFKAKVKCFSPYLNSPDKLKRYYKSKSQAIAFSSYSDQGFRWLKNKSEIEILPKAVLEVKQYFKKNLTKCYKNDQGNLMIGFLLGDKTGIDYLTKRSFSLSGISHLLAVSGLHLTILIQTVYSFLNSIKFGRKKSILATIAFTLFFMALTGFAPSAVRAGIMNIICLVGQIIGRESDSLSALGLAIIIILIKDPFSALDLGLQLSFLATLSIIIFRPKVYNFIYKPLVKIKNNKINKIDKFICDTLAVSISALVLTSPVTVIEFGRLSLVAPITNIILTPVVSPTLIFIALTAIFGGIKFLDVIYKIFALFSSIGVGIIKHIAEIMSSLPFSSISINQKYLYICFISFLVLFLVNKYILKNKNLNKYIYLFSLIIFLVGRLSNDIIMFGYINFEDISEDSSKNKKNLDNKNYIISDSKVSVAILRESEKYLIPNIDDKMKLLGLSQLDYVIISSKIEIDDIIKIISVCKPKKLIADKNTISLIYKNISNTNKNFKFVNEKEHVYIYQKNIFKNNKTLVSVLKNNNIIIKNNAGRISVINKENTLEDY